MDGNTPADTHDANESSDWKPYVSYTSGSFPWAVTRLRQGFYVRRKEWANDNHYRLSDKDTGRGDPAVCLFYGDTPYRGGQGWNWLTSGDRVGTDWELYAVPVAVANMEPTVARGSDVDSTTFNILQSLEFNVGEAQLLLQLGFALQRTTWVDGSYVVGIFNLVPEDDETHEHYNFKGVKHVCGGDRSAAFIVPFSMNEHGGHDDFVLVDVPPFVSDASGKQIDYTTRKVPANGGPIDSADAPRFKNFTNIEKRALAFYNHEWVRKDVYLKDLVDARNDVRKKADKEIESAGNRLAAMVNERNAALKKAETLDKIATATDKALGEVMVERDRLTCKLDTVQRNYLAETAVLRSNLQGARTERTDVMGELRNHRDNLTYAKEKLNELDAVKAERDAARKQRDGAYNENTNVRGQLVTVLNQRDNLARNLESVRRLHAAANETSNLLRKDIEVARAVRDAEMGSGVYVTRGAYPIAGDAVWIKQEIYAKDTAAVRKELEAVKGDLEETQKKHNRAQIALLDERAKRMEAENKKEKAEKAKSLANVRADNLQLELNGVEDRLRSTDANLIQTRAALTTKRREFDALCLTIGGRETKIVDLERKVKTQAELLDQLEGALKKERDALTAEKLLTAHAAQVSVEAAAKAVERAIDKDLYGNWRA